MIKAVIIWLGIFIFSYACLGGNFPLSINDATGRTVSIQHPPQRIISTMPSNTEILYALGLGDKIVGVTQNCNYPPAALSKEKVGRYEMNLEKIVSLKPDLIVMLWDAQKSEVEKLRKFRLPVFAINPHSVEEVAASIVLLGQVTGQTREAEILTDSMRSSIARLKPSGKKRVDVLTLVSLNPLIAAGKSTFIDSILKTAGLNNLAAVSAGPYPLIGLETINRMDPELLIIPSDIVKSADQVYNDSRFKNLSAVKSRKILFIEPDILVRPGPRIIKALEKIWDTSIKLRF
jgi:iron complex transport system substrate-binding protein